MMSLKNSLIVLWVYIMYVLGIWLFLSGYLLKRIVVHQNSTSVGNLNAYIDCQDITKLRFTAKNFDYKEVQSSTQSISNDKTNLQRFNKAVIIIIDSLRFDFVLSNNSNTDDEFYKHKMPIFRHIIEKHPVHAVLFRLTADPPTTTLQRLKGLTTGSLPTFIDVSLNFASSEITEDNLIRQMKAFHKRIVFMGDDTWESIFPNLFLRSFPYPSFNVKDLDTVDDGILEHLYEEMDKSDSDVIIAHFLGVDHCGHRYGPRHPEMARKLQQMNSVIQNVTEKLKDDTILFVLGDHGMTESGDHGGDSIQEISTALFFYSRSKFKTFTKVENIPTVNQVDIVPTLSLLLGLPIPFSNLGTVISSLFTLTSKQVCFDEETDSAVASALSAAENSLQVQRYLHAYNNISNEMSDSFVESAQKKLEDINVLWGSITNDITKNQYVLFNISKEYQKYLENVRNVCAEKWATFNVKFIVFGIIILGFAVVWNFCIAEKLDYKHFLLISCFIILMSALTLSYVYRLFNPFMWFALGIVLLSFILLKKFRDQNFLYYFLIICCVLFILFCIAIYTNLYLFDYIECLPAVFIYLFVGAYVKSFSEDYFQALRTVFNISTLFTVILFLTSFSNSFIINEDRITLYLLQSVIVYRFTPIFTDSIKLYISSNSNKSKVSKKSPKGVWRYMLQPLFVMCLILCIRMGSMFYKCREEQIFCENSNIIISLEKLHQSQTYKLLRLMMSLASEMIPVVTFLATVCYKYTIKSQTVSAVCVKYGIFFVCMLTSLRWWLNIVSPNVVDRILKGNEVILTRTASVTCVIMCIIIIVFPILADKPWEIPSKEIYTGSLVSLIVIVLQFLYLTAGDALSTAIMFMSFSALLYFILVQFSNNESEPRVWLDVLIWSLLSRHWFYATAHQTAFTSIQWDAAFLLNHKEVYSYVLSGALVLINTFSSFIFHGLGLPLIWILQESSQMTSKALLRLHMKYLFYSGVKLLGAVCAAFILRRHLMVWKIFSPKLLYEVIIVLITMVSVSIGHSFMMKVTSQHHKLIRMNLSHMFTSKDQ